MVFYLVGIVVQRERQCVSVSVVKQDKRRNELHGLREHLIIIESILVQLETYTVTQIKC